MQVQCGRPIEIAVNKRSRADSSAENVQTHKCQQMVDPDGFRLIMYCIFGTRDIGLTPLTSEFAVAAMDNYYLSYQAFGRFCSTLILFRYFVISIFNFFFVISRVTQI